jgi:hypothetical protein
MSLSSPAICTCPTCRRMIRRQIAECFRTHRRWLDRHAIVRVARLGWVPELFFAIVLSEMVSLGLLIAVEDATQRSVLYLLSTLPPASGPTGKRGVQ